jgi:uncharacterized protein
MDSTFLGEHLNGASSSQLNAEQIRTFLTPILARYTQVIVLTVSSEMSGTYSRFREVIADMQLPASRIALIDTKVNSGAQGLLVREAADLIARGLPLEEIVAAIEALKARTGILVSVLDIEPMARSGRISERVGKIMIRLGFKPLVTIDRDGKGTIKGIAFSEKRNRRLLLRELAHRKLAHYCIVHAGADDRVASLQQDLFTLTGTMPRYVTEISSVVTLFAGRGSVAVAFIEKEA